MRPVTKETMPQLKRVFMDKNNSVARFARQYADGSTAIFSLPLGNMTARKDSVKLINGMIPKDSGKLFCTIS